MPGSWANGLCGKNLHDITDPANVYFKNGKPNGCRPCVSQQRKDRWNNDPEFRADAIAKSKERHKRTYVRKTNQRPGYCRADLHDLTIEANRYPDRNTRTGKLSYACRPCRDAANIKWRDENRDLVSARNKARSVFQRYGLTREELDAIWAAQGGRCRICLQVPEPTRRSDMVYVVDHDHACCPGTTTCGRCIRGLLCPQCNSGLGNFRDNGILLRRAAQYVRDGAVISRRLGATTVDWIAWMVA